MTQWHMFGGDLCPDGVAAFISLPLFPFIVCAVPTRLQNSLSQMENKLLQETDIACAFILLYNFAQM